MRDFVNCRANSMKQASSHYFLFPHQNIYSRVHVFECLKDFVVLIRGVWCKGAEITLVFLRPGHVLRGLRSSLRLQISFISTTKIINTNYHLPTTDPTSTSPPRSVGHSRPHTRVNHGRCVSQELISLNLPDHLPSMS